MGSGSSSGDDRGASSRQGGNKGGRPFGSKNRQKGVTQKRFKDLNLGAVKKDKSLLKLLNLPPPKDSKSKSLKQELSNETEDLLGGSSEKGKSSKAKPPAGKSKKSAQKKRKAV